MADLVESTLGYFFPGDCYRVVVEEYNFFDGTCLKMFNSRMLSLSILLGALIVKVPQILKVVRAGSVEGLSYLAYFLELGAVTFTCTYNYDKGFPFSSWGESFFIAIQVVILLMMMFYYNGQLPPMVVFLLVYAGVVWYLVSPYVTTEILTALQTLNIPLIVASRLSQVYTTYANGTTGQLSFITCFLNWAGTSSRIFTTLQETQDPIMLTTYISAFIVNSIIMIQFAWYWNVDTQKGKKEV